MRTCYLLFATVLFTTAGAAPSGAQTELREGIRVRITPLGAQRMTGTLKSTDPDSLIFFADPGAVRFAIAHSTIRRFEVSHGRSASAGARKGALWGGAIWGGLNTAAVIPEGHKSVSQRAAIALIQTGMGAGLGALIGMAVGAERWESVPLTPSVSALPTDLRFGLSVR